MERSNGIMRLLVAVAVWLVRGVVGSFAIIAFELLLAMVIVAVIVTVRFRRNPRGNARHLRW